MADVTVTYEDTEIASLSDSGTKTLKTAGKYCDDDIVIDFVKSGGGGWTLLATESLGTISYSSSSDADTGTTVTVSGVSAYDILLFISERPLDSNRHIATAAIAWVYGTSDITTKNKVIGGNTAYNVVTKVAPPGGDLPISSTGTASAYGIYPYYSSVSISNDEITVPMHMRYDSSITRNINGSYTTYVYGITMYDLFGFNS